MSIIVAVSNGANLTDGIDGLATGTSAIIGATLGILAWVFGNTGPNESTEGLGFTGDGAAYVFDDLPSGSGALWRTTYETQSSSWINNMPASTLREVRGGDFEESTGLFWAVCDYFKRVYSINTGGSVTFQSNLPTRLRKKARPAVSVTGTPMQPCAP